MQIHLMFQTSGEGLVKSIVKMAQLECDLSLVALSKMLREDVLSGQKVERS